MQRHTDEQSMGWKKDKIMRCQYLPFLEKLAHAEPLWCHMTKEQQNASIIHVDKFYNDIKRKYCIMPEFGSEDISWAL